MWRRTIALRVYYGFNRQFYNYVHRSFVAMVPMRVDDRRGRCKKTCAWSIIEDSPVRLVVFQRVFPGMGHVAMVVPTGGVLLPPNFITLMA